MDHHGPFHYHVLLPLMPLPLRQHIPSRMASPTAPHGVVTNAKEVLLTATSSTIPGRILLAVPTFGIREVLLTIWSEWHPHHAVLGGC